MCRTQTVPPRQRRQIKRGRCAAQRKTSGRRRWQSPYWKRRKRPAVSALHRMRTARFRKKQRRTHPAQRKAQNSPANRTALSEGPQTTQRPPPRSVSAHAPDILPTRSRRPHAPTPPPRLQWEARSPPPLRTPLNPPPHTPLFPPLRGRADDGAKSAERLSPDTQNTMQKRSRMPNGTYGSAFCLLQRLCFSRRTLTPFPLLPDGPPARGPIHRQICPCTRPAQRTAARTNRGPRQNPPR